MGNMQNIKFEDIKISKVKANILFMLFSFGIFVIFKILLKIRLGKETGKIKPIEVFICGLGERKN